VDTNRYRPTATVALVLSADALGGALIGAAAELVGFRALFPRPAESPRDVLGAERPALILADCDAPSASDEAFLGPALMSGARVFVFGQEPRIHDLEHLVDRYRLELFILPRDVGALLEAMASPGSQRPRSRTS
jgi:hypothetical protein